MDGYNRQVEDGVDSSTIGVRGMYLLSPLKSTCVHVYRFM